VADPLPIRVEVPVCAFRPYASREYQDTFPVPPPATVYGMLLSLLGVPREEKARHRGAEMALAVAGLPGRSKVFRKLRRGDELKDTRPDYQDLLMDLTLWLWLRPGGDVADPPLSARVPAALADPAAVARSGGLSLGESSYLVDVVRIDPAPPDRLIFLTPDDRGFYSLPVWVDHLVRANTVLLRFRLSAPIAVADGLAVSWIRIGGRT
jgi:CRISPR-associated protein Cas5t